MKLRQADKTDAVLAITHVTFVVELNYSILRSPVRRYSCIMIPDSGAHKMSDL